MPGLPSSVEGIAFPMSLKGFGEDSREHDDVIVAHGFNGG